MADPTPNDRQRALIENIEGTYCVDAGAGTGKTFAVTRRYAAIVDREDVDPEDVLLATFTDNAATEMRERIVAESGYGVRSLADAPIGTFHSLCQDLLDEYGHDAPSYLGLDDCIAGSTRILDEEVVEASRFRTFLDRFGDDHPEYAEFLRVLDDPAELLGLVRQLAAKGVFPTEDGWYRRGERHLDGDVEAFEAAFAAANEPRNGGRKQSRLRSKLTRYGRNRCYLPDAPERAEVRGKGTKRVPREVARRVFEEDRDGLKRFVHDVYHGYLRFALGRNYLNFGFLQGLAFVLLCEDARVREAVAHEYVMVDEFQDTSEIQFKLALLLSDTDNLCVVGDWKQSIYSFQYAAVENITDFESRLRRFADELNDDAERVPPDPGPVETIELVDNYRSTQPILDFAERCLVAPATGREEVEEAAVLEEVTPLVAAADREDSRIEAFAHEDEHEAVLTKIGEVVGNEAYSIEDDGERRPPEYGDVAVLTRTRDYGRELLGVAEEHGFPMAYEGGIELFRTDQAKLLLAWLRILDGDDRGWAVVMECAGYVLDEVDHVLETGAYPSNLVAFRNELADLETVGGIARLVFARYGYEGATADVVVDAVESIHDQPAATRGDLVRTVERAVEAGSTYEVDAGGGTNAVTVQTIHAAKGLEYPIVILANMNAGRFPPGGRDDAVVAYREPVGLRGRKVYAEADGHPYVYDDWRADVRRHCLPDDHDEERRLLYVAATRAERHLLFAAGAESNAFLDALPVEVETVEPSVEEAAVERTRQARLEVVVPAPDGPVGHTPHSLMREDVFEEVEDGRGPEFGTRVHEFAEAYARGEVRLADVDQRGGDEPRAADFDHVAAFLDGLDGDLRPEEDVFLPLTVDGERVTISGTVDLVHVLPDVVEVVDFKTDPGRHAEREYAKQLSVYYHVVAASYPGRSVTAGIYYTAMDEYREVNSLSRNALETLVGNLE